MTLSTNQNMYLPRLHFYLSVCGAPHVPIRMIFLRTVDSRWFPLVFVVFVSIACKLKQYFPILYDLKEHK